MATQCGHIYCLDCATFHFSQGDPCCAVCRKAQTLENMVRLFPDCEEDSAKGTVDESHDDEQISSSPVSVMSIERAGQDAVNTLKKALAGREDMQDAILACNTFVNCVSPRERPHINEALLQDISFQLNLVQTVCVQALHDNQGHITRLKNEVQRVRAAETAARLQIDGHARALRRAEKQIAAKNNELQAQQERYELIYQQCIVATEDATRMRVRVAKVLQDLEDMSVEMQKWKEQAAKAKRKYYALKSEIKELKQVAQGSTGHAHRRSASDDLEVI
ncbi:hypothetical protein PYCCODRAFT_1441272 [Trametes coccinea BRFM310]|uniref:RING-type domain-containing protein n=1 Tax=Trametes coccinea (strain BRFM310) TaxID=1353009 RepID=A0A1Y2J7B6_TRAC3|nr:hypothetical protein PYCCODRAFT_1441272 [Trametes coccinea BRFM310]